MARYTVNRYCELFSESSRKNRRRGQSEWQTASMLWYRHWAWFRRCGPWGKTGIVCLLWPTILVVVAALAAAALITVALVGVVWLALQVARSK